MLYFRNLELILAREEGDARALFTRAPRAATSNRVDSQQPHDAVIRGRVNEAVRGESCRLTVARTYGAHRSRQRAAGIG